MPSKTADPPSADDEAPAAAPPDRPAADALVLHEGPAAAHTLNATYERIAVVISQGTENAVQAQQQVAIEAQAATVQGVASLLSLQFDRLARPKATTLANPKKEP